MNLPYEPKKGGSCVSQKKCLFNWFLDKVGKNIPDTDLDLGLDVVCRLRFNKHYGIAVKDRDVFLFSGKDFAMISSITNIINRNDRGMFEEAFVELYNLLGNNLDWFCQYAPESKAVYLEMKAIIEEYEVKDNEEITAGHVIEFVAGAAC